jgi:lambda family phage minor tail protein L
MPIPIRDINSLQHSTIVHLFELDLSALGVTVNPVLRFCNLTNGTSSVFWKGLEYPPFPIKAEGYEYNGKGSLPRPTVTVSNLLGVITNLVLDNDDLLGAKLTRKRTLARYLDGMPNANTTIEFPDDVYFIERKVNENALFVEFELASTLDLEGFMIPNRIMTTAFCAWRRSSECIYAEGKICDHTLNGSNGCKTKWGQYAELPFGGFPGLDNQGGYS